MRGQVEQEVLAHKRRQVDRLRSMQLCVHSKCGHLNFVHKILQTRYATQFYWLRQRASRPKGTSSNAHVDVVMQRAGTANPILVPVQMQTLRRNLLEMNFHSLNLSNVMS